MSGVCSTKNQAFLISSSSCILLVQVRIFLEIMHQPDSKLIIAGD
jgi:hypothetical protein